MTFILSQYTYSGRFDVRALFVFNVNFDNTGRRLTEKITLINIFDVL